MICFCFLEPKKLCQWNVKKQTAVKNENELIKLFLTLGLWKKLFNQYLLELVTIQIICAKRLFFSVVFY